MSQRHADTRSANLQELELAWACKLYSGGLVWDIWLTAVSLLAMPGLTLIGVLTGIDLLSSELPDRFPLILALSFTLLPALALAYVCLGHDSLANEGCFYANMQKIGLTAEQLSDKRPVYCLSPLVLLVYFSDLWHYPTGRRHGANRDGGDWMQAWRIINDALRGYYRECLLRGYPPVGRLELAATLALWLALLASVGVIAATVQAHAEMLRSILQGDSSLPLGVYTAMLVFVDSAVLLSLRTEARLRAFLDALQAYLVAQIGKSPLLWENPSDE